MKKSISLYLALITVLLSFCLIACKKRPPIEPEHEPEYVDITFDEFSEAAGEFLSLDGLMDSYTIFAKEETDSPDGQTEFQIDAKVDLSDIENVSLSACVIDKRTAYEEKPSGGGSKPDDGDVSDNGQIKPIAVQEVTNTTIYNLYLYDSKLYVDRTINTSTQWDKIDNFDNNLLAMGFSLPKEGFWYEFLEGIGNAVYYRDQIDLIINNKGFFESYMTISYCEELSNYKFKIDVPVSKQTSDGTVVKPIKIELDIYANNKLKSLSGSLVAQYRRLNFALQEKKLTIDIPNKPEIYTGSLLDEFQEKYVNRNGTLADFAGKWSNEHITLDVEGDNIAFYIDGDKVEIRDISCKYNVLTFGDGTVKYELRLNIKEGNITVYSSSMNPAILSKEETK